MRKIVIVSISSTLVVIALSGGILAYKSLHKSSADGDRVTPAGSVAFNSSDSAGPARSIPLRQDGNSGSLPSVTPDPNALKVTTNTSDTSANQAALPGNNASGSSGDQNNTANVYHEPSLAELQSYAQYKDSGESLFGELAKGDGAAAVMGKKVAVYYKGWLTDGTVFDQSKPGSPFIFTPGDHKVILGWEQDILGMKVGGKRRFIIPSKFGYGAQKVGTISPNSLLVFDVDLLEVEK